MTQVNVDRLLLRVKMLGRGTGPILFRLARQARSDTGRGSGTGRSHLTPSSAVRKTNREEAQKARHTTDGRGGQRICLRCDLACRMIDFSLTQVKVKRLLSQAK